MKSNRGFSLLETLLYLALFVFVGGALFGILSNVVRVSTREVSGDEVATQLQFAMQTINRLVKDSSNIEMATSTATTTLKLRMPVSTQDPTCIILSGGTLKLAQGPDEFNKQNCTTTTTDITTDKVVVDSALFKRIEFPGGHDQVLVDMQFSNLTQGASKISRALRSGISRASAATFDSDLLPNTNGVYEVGFATPVDKRWKNLAASNLIYLGKLASDPGTSGNTGSVYYNTTSNTFRGNSNGTWNDLGSSLWMATSTNNIYSNISGNVGIGTNNPTQKLQIGNFTITGTTTPEAIEMGATYSITPGANPKIRLWNDNTGNIYGLGVSPGQFDFMIPGGTHYSWNISGVEKMRMDSTGNVGIGTASPEDKLAVVGDNISVNNYGFLGQLRSGQGTILGHNVKAGTANNTMVSVNTGYYGQAIRMYYDQGIAFHTTASTVTAGATFDTVATERMRITNAGNVGIGTASPTVALDVVSTNNNYIKIKTSGVDTIAGVMAENDARQWIMRVAGDTNDNFEIRDGSVGSTKMAITTAGNVGIGTAVPTYKVEVKGNIVNTNPSTGWLGLTGDLPGYANDIYPTLKTNANYIYFSAGGSYSAYMSVGGVWTANSDKNKKENFVPLNSQEILEKIGRLPIVQWNYKAENAGIRHIGPFAQDFYKAFKLNGTDDTMISTIDPSGVALVGIQGLLERSKEQQQQIDELKEEIAKLKK